MALSDREELECLILVALGSPCEPCSQGVGAILEHMYGHQPLQEATSRCGCSARWQLARRLALHGFPAPSALKDWLRFLGMIQAWQRHKRGLHQQAIAYSVEPSVLHRMVRRLTGGTWQIVKQRDLASWLDQFASVVGTGVRCKRAERAKPNAL